MLLQELDTGAVKSSSLSLFTIFNYDPLTPEASISMRLSTMSILSPIHPFYIWSPFVNLIEDLSSIKQVLADGSR